LFRTLSQINVNERNVKQEENKKTFNFSYLEICAAKANSRVSRLFTAARYNGPMIDWKHRDLQKSQTNYTEIELLTIKEVAAMLKASVSLVRRLQQGRHIAFIKVGGSIRFHKQDILEYLRQRTVDKIT
jgi:excisionase family DNA binding protein